MVGLAVVIVVLQSDRPKWRKRYQMLRHQGNLIILLQQLVNTVSQLKEDRSKRVGLTRMG